MRCAITGSTGVLGKEFVRLYNNKINFIAYKKDITNRKNIINWILKKDFDYFIHFAAIVPTKIVHKNYRFAKKVNYQGTKNIVDGLKKKNKKIWFFFSSTSHVYNFSKKPIKENSETKPISRYGITKFLSEKYIQNNFMKSKVSYSVGRIFSYTHYRQNKSFFIPKLFCKNKININFVNSLNTIRDFADIRDICRAIYFLMKYKKKGIFNIASGKKINLVEIFNLIKKKKVFFNKFKSKSDLYANIDKLKSLGWKPRFNINHIINNFRSKI
jgi:UDP-glucose 4-epimerase